VFFGLLRVQEIMHTLPMCTTTVGAMRPSGTAEQLEKRRRRAIALLQAGTPYREVARPSVPTIVRHRPALELL
jgi:hypothetical protein